MGLESLERNFLTTRVEDLVKWARRNSIWPATFGLACCAIEMMGARAAHYDLARWGMEIFRASPRQADLMIVAGGGFQKKGPGVRPNYDPKAQPPGVISPGVGASPRGAVNKSSQIPRVGTTVPAAIYLPRW